MELKTFNILTSHSLIHEVNSEGLERISRSENGSSSLLTYAC